MSDLVTVGSFHSLPEAGMAKARLESNGIHAVVHGEQVNRLFSGMGALSGTIDVLVLPEDADGARAVLALDFSGYDDSLTALEAEQSDSPEAESMSSRDRCPHCRSEDLTVAPFPPMTVFLSMFLLGVPLMFIKREHSCDICGTHWRA